MYIKKFPKELLANTLTVHLCKLTEYRVIMSAVTFSGCNIVIFNTGLMSRLTVLRCWAAQTIKKTSRVLSHPRHLSLVSIGTGF